MNRSKPTFNLFALTALIISILGGMVTAKPAQAAEHTSGSNVPLGAPPYSGTAFLDPDIITPSDPSNFSNSVYVGRGFRSMYDRRADATVTVYAYLFRVSYSNGTTIEAQVNPEFGNATNAGVEAQKYGWLIGQLPAVLRKNIKMLWIHKGDADFGGAPNAIVIHTDRGVIYGDYIEEILIHESAHTSLDPDHAAAPDWLQAQTLDGEFISDYASTYPDREDIAESFLTFFAIRFKADRISGTDATTIQQTIPNRINYFDSQYFDMTPVTSSISFTSRGAEDGWILESTVSSNAGGSMNATSTTLRIGEDANVRQYRSILSFDTSALPDTAIVTRVTLQIRPASAAGNLISLFDGIMVDVRQGTLGNPALEVGDFEAYTDYSAGALFPILTKGWYTLNVSEAASSFNVSGFTQLRVRFLLESYGAGTNIFTFYSGNALPAYRPRLTVQYYIP